jgi:GGDEF domain-containing protein
MENNSLDYYGYDRFTFNDCKDLITQMNRRHLEILNIWLVAVTAVYMLFAWQNSFGFSEQNAPFFLIFLILEIAFEVVLVRRRSVSDNMNRIFVHLDIVALLLLGIICSASQPYMAATIYLVMLMIVSFSYIITMFRMIFVLIFGCGCFLLVSYLVKPGSIFNQDVLNVIVVLILSVVFHYTFQRARIRQFITYRESTKMQQELEIKSSFDALTSLLNRGRFFSMAGEVMRQNRDDYMILGLMDLDKFKEINDTLGHQMGDKVIQLAGDLLLKTLEIDYGDKWYFPERAVKESLNFAGRLGGDEFVVLIRDKKDPDEVRKLFERLLENLNGIRLEGLNGIGASIGITVIKKEDRDIDSAYTRADEALYESKENGRNRMTFDE